MKKTAILLWLFVVLPFATLLGFYMGRFPWPFLVLDSPAEVAGSILVSLAIWGIPVLFAYEVIAKARTRGGDSE